MTSRHRQLFDGDDLASQQTQPLEEGYGTHFAYVWVGTPPQRQSVILDTGSTKTAFPCDPCDECGQYLKYHESGPFIPTQSSTYVLVESNPGWSAHYSEGDGWEANIVKDMTWLGGTAVNDIFGADQRSIFFKFGCMTKLTGLFVTQLADGIMGLGFASSESYVSNLKIGGAVERDAFSLCFTHEGGTMSLGGPSTPNHLTSMQYAAMGKQGSHFWGVHWLDLRIIPSPFALHSPSSDVHDDDIECMTSESGSITDCGASPSDFGGRFKTIVDSGTTWTYVPTKLKEAFCKRWLDVVGWEYQTLTSIDLTVDISTLPDIVFVLEGKDEGTDVHVSVGPRQYLDEYCQYIDDDSPELGMQCYYFLSIIFEGSTQILGANFMADKDVYFDSEVCTKRGVIRLCCRKKREDLRTVNCYILLFVFFLFRFAWIYFVLAYLIIRFLCGRTRSSASQMRIAHGRSRSARTLHRSRRRRPCPPSRQRRRRLRNHRHRSLLG